MIIGRINFTREKALALYREALSTDGSISTAKKESARSQIVEIVRESGTKLDPVDINCFTWAVQSAFKNITGI